MGNSHSTHKLSIAKKTLPVVPSKLDQCDSSFSENPQRTDDDNIIHENLFSPIKFRGNRFFLKQKTSVEILRWLPLTLTMREWSERIVSPWSFVKIFRQKGERTKNVSNFEQAEGQIKVSLVQLCSMYQSIDFNAFRFFFSSFPSYSINRNGMKTKFSLLSKNGMLFFFFDCRSSSNMSDN